MRSLTLQQVLEIPLDVLYMWAILLWLHRQRACQRPLQPGPPCDLFHLTCHDLWCYNCNSYKTSNPWLATIKPLTTITKDKLIKLEQATAGSVQVDGSRVADVNLHQEGQAVSRQLGRPAQNKPKITTLENMLLHLNGTASFSHYNMAISQPKSERIGSTGASVQALVHAKCFAKVPIHSHANTCYLNGILQVLAHLPPFAQYFIALQPILQSLDAGIYTNLLQQFTLTMVALQLVTDASIPLSSILFRNYQGKGLISRHSA